MAKNTGIGYKKGTVSGETELVNPATTHWTTRDSKAGQVVNKNADGKSGRFVDQNRDSTPFKEVRKEK